MQLDVEDRGSQTHSANAGGLGRRGAITRGSVEPSADGQRGIDDQRVDPARNSGW